MLPWSYFEYVCMFRLFGSVWLWNHAWMKIYEL